ncbi:MAG: hypothetical protein AAFV71_28675 [Cyanobacteria bacterium J06633_8]
MSLIQKIGQVITLSTLIFGSTTGMNIEKASARSYLFERCRGHYCYEIKSIKKKFLKNGVNGRLYSIKVLSRSYPDGSISGRVSKGKFSETGTQYIYCSSSKPAYISKYENKYIVNTLNPGGFVDEARKISHVLYWNTCHNHNPSDFFAMERKAKRLGYPVNLKQEQFELRNGKYDGISLGKSKAEKPLTVRNKSSNIDCSAPANNGSYMRLERTGRSNKLGNPLYRLCLYARGQVLASYDTVNGRAHTQNRNRHKSGTQAPLPDGRYRLARWYVRGTHPEVGGRFLRMNQTFRTGRTALGIHYDPSFEKRNGEDGTAGTIALTNRSDLGKVLNFHRRYRFRYIDVDIL